MIDKKFPGKTPSIMWVRMRLEYEAQRPACFEPRLAGGETPWALIGRRLPSLRRDRPRLTARGGNESLPRRCRNGARRTNSFSRWTL